MKQDMIPTLERIMDKDSFVVCRVNNEGNLKKVNDFLKENGEYTYYADAAQFENYFNRRVSTNRNYQILKELDTSDLSGTWLLLKDFDNVWNKRIIYLFLNYLQNVGCRGLFYTCHVKRVPLGIEGELKERYSVALSDGNFDRVIRQAEIELEEIR